MKDIDGSINLDIDKLQHLLFDWTVFKFYLEFYFFKFSSYRGD
jgi:hypothetical protein